MYQNIDELVHAANQLAGLTLAELAERCGIMIPSSLRREKGWIGQLLEFALGASAGSKPQQDFPELGVELKTLPIANNGIPLESTFVCTAPLLHQQKITWETSSVHHKLSAVLWIPVFGDRQQDIASRMIGNPWLWHPTTEQEKIIRRDWEEIMELIALGKVESISARHGEALQLRPKAANGQSLTPAIGSEGTIIQTRPRGFYLRSSFTRELLHMQFYL
ncbi:DNA mismatch repair endonuclease MutH [Tolumonas auensis]|jgi:DNA mismatch repair protein MutH|uniref:DNA mismatch repair endonuclease MutH n=1 Tax=Tolumonas auensis TaxID=43948 RepID=UPI002AA5F232|nr:DNA mismatch repair endonuclease MutH [Tolumonas auensis]